MEAFGDQAVFIDVTRLLRRLRDGRLPTGVDRVCLAYVRQFRDRAQALLIEGQLAVGLDVKASRALFDTFLTWGKWSLSSNLWNAVTTILRMRLRTVPDGSWVLNMGHSGLDRAGYLAWLKRKQIRLLVMAHDLIPITHPEFCRADATAAHERRLQVILGQAAGIVSNSRVTAAALQAHAHGLQIPVPPMEVIPLGVDAAWKTHQQPTGGVPRSPYFLMLSTIEPRKNHAFLLHLWERLYRELAPEDTPSLLLIGQKGWMCDGVIERLLHDETLRPWVTWLPSCSDGDLAYYLDHAQALLFPSAVEGYGLPLLEALQRGTPVLSSPLPAFYEVAGEIPDYLPLDDETAWLTAICDYFHSEHPRRQAQLQRLAGYRAPSWEEHFRAFANFVDRL